MTDWNRYGVVDWTRIDVKALACLSVDLRTMTGAPPGTVDETGMCPPGQFTLSVCNPVPGDPPIGEVRLWLNNQEVRMVGALTLRPNVVEVTPDHIAASVNDPDYRAGIQRWLGIV